MKVKLFIKSEQNCNIMKKIGKNKTELLIIKVKKTKIKEIKVYNIF